jgi:hypothetical protein
MVPLKPVTSYMYYCLVQISISSLTNIGKSIWLWMKPLVPAADIMSTQAFLAYTWQQLFSNHERERQRSRRSQTCFSLQGNSPPKSIVRTQPATRIFIALFFFGEKRIVGLVHRCLIVPLHTPFRCRTASF